MLQYLHFPNNIFEIVNGNFSNFFIAKYNHYVISFKCPKDFAY